MSAGKRVPFRETPEGIIKQCTQCRRWYPATPEHFYRIREGFLKLQAWCKRCMGAHSRKRRLERRAKWPVGTAHVRFRMNGEFRRIELYNQVAHHRSLIQAMQHIAEEQRAPIDGRSS